MLFGPGAGGSSRAFASCVAAHGENDEALAQANRHYDTGVGQEANVPADIVHDDHILSVGIGAPNAQRKDAGKAPQSGPDELPRNAADVSGYLSRP